jgi:protein-disulfide isomerase-like protein with CxxC motif
MTIRTGNALFSGAGFCRVAVTAAVLAAGLAVAGCGGGSAAGEAVPVAQGARDTGTYPNLNIKPEVAAQQFTDAERDAKLKELKAVRDRAAASPGVTTEAADAAALDKLAKNHAGDALKQIEGKCDPALDPTCK